MEAQGEQTPKYLAQAHYLPNRKDNHFEQPDAPILGGGYSLYSPPSRPLSSFSAVPTLGGVINGLVTPLLAG